MSKARKIEQITLSLRYDFRPHEKQEKQDLLTRLIHEKARVQAEKKNALKAFNSQISEIDTQVEIENEKVRSGFEYREIDCQTEWHYDLGQVATIRLDTFGVVHTRPMTPEERRYQMTIEQEEKNDLKKQKKELLDDMDRLIEKEKAAKAEKALQEVGADIVHEVGLEFEKEGLEPVEDDESLRVPLEGGLG